MSDEILRKNQYTTYEELGRGAFGIVKKMIDTVENRIYALKRIDMGSNLIGESVEMECFSKEYEIMRNENLLHVVKAHGSSFDPDNLRFYISMDYYPTDLRSLVRAKGQLAFQQAKNILIDILLGKMEINKINIS